MVLGENPGLDGSVLPELNWEQYTVGCSIMSTFACPLPAGSGQCNHPKTLGNGETNVAPTCSTPVPTSTLVTAREVACR